MAKKSQIQKFRDKARELKSDESEVGFATSLRAIASHKPKSSGDGAGKAQAKRSQKKPGR